ncbi:MAG: molybdopterin molybdotransferase MoeA [Alphaproteobacteria bacterium]|nr:molybdopterin molybdotransferase MoeA [Alphaproteobacteria bacterium]MBU1403754.1 molybdopterin molybdotransferase MoeA [Alphaproteobacteria bacterium]MBU1589589.1 molybdopterin molybdotransferase MoeA [Alphaproteobacteria bacterium]MBU1792168.1 molybdopterin molybdotransferase MoeA [Alphaproteobacteria bacterium]MBU2106261.1 molybdopterin molybdotransferase MoeA [Alphaproteobacteria bacterium]
MLPNATFPTVAERTCNAGKAGEVLAVDIAGAKAIAAAIPVTGTETLPLIESLGRICANAVASSIDLPPFDNSAMDGYALRLGELAGKGPWQLPVAARIAAGQIAGSSYPAGCTVRIFTGAPLPAGFDAVVMQENCERFGAMVRLSQKPPAGQNVRIAGEDVANGATVAAPGTLLTPERIALLAATGTASVAVLRKVRIGLVSTGSELVEPGGLLSAGQIYNSNRFFLRAALDRPWIEPVDFGIVADDPEAIRTMVSEAARRCDVVITTGGVSAGEEDHMMDVLKRENAELEVLKVAMRPGKPVTVGRIGSALFFGLPGNPYATAATFARIALPAIKRTAGFQKLSASWMPAVSGFTYRRKQGRTEYVPVTWSRLDADGLPIVEMLGRGSSASLSPLAMARATAVLPPDMPAILPGMRLRIEPLCD